MDLDYKTDLERLSNNNIEPPESIFLIKREHEILINHANQKILLLEKEKKDIDEKNKCLEEQILENKKEFVNYLLSNDLKNLFI